MKKLFSFLSLALVLAFSSCSKDDEGDTGSTGPASANLPSSISGTVLLMKFTAPQANAPYTLDQKVQFTFSSSGLLGIDSNPADMDGDEISIASFTESGGEYIWSDANAGFEYHLSLQSDGSVNEVNLFQISDNSFQGQFVPDAGSTGNLVAVYEGTYTVTSVDKGSHSRMTVSIDADGNIDFDSAVQLNYSDFALISDRLDCCQGIWIDMSPYPSDPYQRVNLFIDTNTNELNKIEYMPQYPSIAGRVTVNLSKGTGGGSGNSNNELNVSGDFVKVGGAVYQPDTGVECTSCPNSEKYTWTQLESSGPDRVFSIEIINATGLVILDFSASSAFAASANDLASLGIAHDPATKTFTFTDVDLNEKFSQPGSIRINGKLTYQ